MSTEIGGKMETEFKEFGKMQVLKVNINLTPMEIERPDVWFAVFGKENRRFMSGESIPTHCDIEKEHWKAQRVYLPNKNFKTYLIKVDENDLCQELFQVSNDLIEARVIKLLKERGYITREHHEDMLRGHRQHLRKSRAT